MHFEFLSSLNIGLRVIDLLFEEVEILFNPKYYPRVISISKKI